MLAPGWNLGGQGWNLGGQARSGRSRSPVRSNNNDWSASGSSSAAVETPICSFFAKGFCGFGDSCTNRHEAAPKQEVCKFFADGFCGFGDQCTNAHVAPEKTEICKFFAKGFCGFGDECVNKHEAPATAADWKSTGGNDWKSSGGSKSWGGGGGGNDDEEVALGVKWKCTACWKANSMTNIICHWCDAPKPGEEFDAESLLFEKYVSGFKKWQRKAEENQTTWQNYCDSNGNARKYDPRRKDLPFLRTFFQKHSIDSPDPVADAALDAAGGPKHSAFAPLNLAIRQAPDAIEQLAPVAAPAADPMVAMMAQYQLQLYLQQMALAQQQQQQAAQPVADSAGQIDPNMYALLAAQYGQAGSEFAAAYGLK